jgi:hypothetical protein
MDQRTGWRISFGSKAMVGVLPHKQRLLVYVALKGRAELYRDSCRHLMKLVTLVFNFCTVDPKVTKIRRGHI